MRKNNFNYDKIKGVKKECPLCHKMVGITAFKRHVRSCKGLKIKFDSKKYLQENSKFKCPICNKEFDNKLSFGQHYSYCSGKKKIWNKGLTKETDERLKKVGETYSKGLRDGRFKHSFLGKQLTEEHKENISNSMKKVQAEGRGWCIGTSRRNGKKSYPEQFFIKIIENEFIDKNYIYEHPFKIYSLDFAWLHLKKCIEIDGEQHYLYEEYIERDKRKDKVLKDEGWKILRIRWKDMFNETQKYIQIAKDFIEEDVEHLEDNLKKYKRELEEKEREKKKIKKQKEITKCHEIALKVNQLIDSDIDFT